MFCCGLRYDVHDITRTSPFSVFVIMDDPIQIAPKDLAGTKKFVALTGAGISVERTPLSEKISDYIIMGKAGEVIKRLTSEIERLKNSNHP